MRIKSFIAFLLLCESVAGTVQEGTTDTCGESCKMKVVGDLPAGISIVIPYIVLAWWFVYS